MDIYLLECQSPKNVLIWVYGVWTVWHYSQLVPEIVTVVEFVFYNCRDQIVSGDARVPIIDIFRITENIEDDLHVATGFVVARDFREGRLETD
jgi:hypothetical protein